MRIDLHTHSAASDGTESPAAVVRAAKAAGLDVVALTDHDTTSGWAEARVAAREVGIRLVEGIELSCVRQGRSVHLLAYLPDPEDAGLRAAMARVIDERNARVPEIVERLRERGVDVSVADVLAQAGASAAAGRPHVADALVRAGVSADRSAAFTDWLNPGRPGYVHRGGIDLAEGIALVRAAGGAPVIAHPWGRGSRSVLGAEDFAALIDVGLVGIEVDHQDHPPAARAELRRIAEDLGLVRTGSSDHHGAGKVDHDLGVNTTEVAEFERLLAAAVRNAASRS